MDTNTATATTVDDLVGKVAHLRRRPSTRRERVLVDAVDDLGGLVLITGRLLYALNSTAYGRHDSRGTFTTTAYALTDTVDVEATP